MPSKRILIIENDVGFLRAFQDAFTGNDVQIDVVADGKAASQKAKEDLPNVILLSLDLLGNSGYAVYNKLKRHRLTETIPVIILSNASEESFNRQALLNPDQYYLFKPSDLLQIVETTNALIQMGDSPQDASPGAEGPEPIEIAAEEVVEADPQVVETIDAQRHVLLDANEILPPMEDDTTFDEEDEGRPPAQTPSASQIAKKESTRASGSAEIKAEQSSAPPPLPATPLEAVLQAAASATPADTKSLIITIEEEAAEAPHPGNPPTQGEAATEVATEAATEAVTEVATEAATEALDPRTSLSAPVLLTKLHHSQEQIQLLREKVNRLEGKLDERNQAFEKRESDISKLRALTTAHERTMLSLKSTVTAKDRESLEIKEEINQKVQVIIELQEKTDEREKEILQIHEMVSGRDREIKDLSAKYDESLRVKNELQELHETRMSEWEQSHAEATASFEHQRNTLHAEQARAAKEAADRQRTLQGDITTLEASLAEAEKKHLELFDQKKRREEELLNESSALEASLAEAEMKHLEFLDQKKQLEQELRTLLDALQAAKRELAATGEQREELHRELAAERAAHAQTQQTAGRISGLEKDLNAAYDMISANQRQIGELSDEIARQKEAIEKADSAIEEHQSSRAASAALKAKMKKALDEWEP